MLTCSREAMVPSTNMFSSTPSRLSYVKLTVKMGTPLAFVWRSKRRTNRSFSSFPPVASFQAVRNCSSVIPIGPRRGQTRTPASVKSSRATGIALGESMWPWATSFECDEHWINSETEGLQTQNCPVELLRWGGHTGVAFSARS